MNIDLKFVELTADVRDFFFKNRKKGSQPKNKRKKRWRSTGWIHRSRVELKQDKKKTWKKRQYFHGSLRTATVLAEKWRPNCRTTATLLSLPLCWKHELVFLCIRLRTWHFGTEKNAKRWYLWRPPQHEASAADADPGRIGRVEEAEVPPGNRASRGGPQIEFSRTQLKSWCKSEPSAALVRAPTYLYLYQYRREIYRTSREALAMADICNCQPNSKPKPTQPWCNPTQHCRYIPAGTSCFAALYTVYWCCRFSSKTFSHFVYLLFSEIPGSPAGLEGDAGMRAWTGYPIWLAPTVMKNSLHLY